MAEPLAAHFHFLPRALKRVHATLSRLLRGYFERAPGWVLLTTRGRRTGLAREVLLPCARSKDTILVISTYGWRSDWIRNLRKDPRVRVARYGGSLVARAEVIEDVPRKRALVSAHPFFPAAPFAIVHALALTVLRPLLVAFLR